MNLITKHFFAVIAALTVVTTLGCSRILDFRNAEVSNGKIYSSGENTGFSGKVTNVPMSKLPMKFGPLVKIIGTVTKSQALSELLMANALSSMMGKGANGILCDIHTADGVLEGDVECKIAASSALLVRTSFKNGNLHGDMTMYDPKGTNRKISDAIFAEGALTGDSKIYGLDAGKLLHKVSWSNGVADGTEEMYDEGTGKLTFKGHLVGGRYDGEVEKYSPNGQLIEKSIWKNNVRQSTPDNDAKPDACVDKWIDAFRKEKGAEAMIAADQISEWEAWCKEGKRPG